MRGHGSKLDARQNVLIGALLTGMADTLVNTFHGLG